jgi:hypothetical protein
MYFSYNTFCLCISNRIHFVYVFLTEYILFIYFSHNTFCLCISHIIHFVYVVLTEYILFMYFETDQLILFAVARIIRNNRSLPGGGGAWGGGGGHTSFCLVGTRGSPPSPGPLGDDSSIYYRC